MKFRPKRSKKVIEELFIDWMEQFTDEDKFRVTNFTSIFEVDVV